MKEVKINADEGDGYYKVFSAPDVEYVDPVEYFSDCYITPRVSMQKDMVLHEMPGMPIHLIERVLTTEALKDWEKKHQ